MRKSLRLNALQAELLDNVQRELAVAQRHQAMVLAAVLAGFDIDYAKIESYENGVLVVDVEEAAPELDRDQLDLEC